MTHEKPEIDFPDSPPPSDLEVTDLTAGDGTEAVAGKSVKVHYVGSRTPPARSSTPPQPR